MGLATATVKALNQSYSHASEVIGKPPTLRQALTPIKVTGDSFIIHKSEYY